MDVDVILFDWGGTLADVSRQEASWRRGAGEALGILGEGPAALDGLARCVMTAEARAAADPELREATLEGIITEWAASTGRRLGEDEVRAASEAVGAAWPGALEPYAGAVEAVRTLKERGYRLGLVSNCIIPPFYSQKELDRQGFGELLDFAVFSSGVGYRKPSRRTYEAAIGLAFAGGRPGSLSRVLFVGDSPAFDVIAPGRMGMKTALVRRAPGVWPAEDYARAEPDLRIDAVSELPGLV